MKKSYLLLCLLLLSFAGCMSPKDQPVKINPFPELRVRDLAGNIVPLRVQANQVIVINFWGTWCSSCLEEMDTLKKLYETYQPRGVIFLGVALDSSSSVRSFLNQHPVDYDVKIADISAVELLIKYGNTQGALPFTLVFHQKTKTPFLGKLDFKKFSLFLDNQLNSNVHEKHS